MNIPIHSRLIESHRNTPEWKALCIMLKEWRDEHSRLCENVDGVKLYKAQGALAEIDRIIANIHDSLIMKLKDQENKTI